MAVSSASLAAGMDALEQYAPTSASQPAPSPDMQGSTKEKKGAGRFQRREARRVPGAPHSSAQSKREAYQASYIV